MEVKVRAFPRAGDWVTRGGRRGTRAALWSRVGVGICLVAAAGGVGVPR